MSIAITEDHRSLAETVSSFAEKRNLRGAARELLEAADETLPDFWSEFAELGWLGLHLPEDMGGSGYGIDELVIVVEELGRTVTPGPFVPTVIASAVLAATADDELRSRLLPGFADGSIVGAVALGGDVEVTDGVATGDAGVVLGAGLASVILVPVGDDVAVVEVGDGVTIDDACQPRPEPPQRSRHPRRCPSDGHPRRPPHADRPRPRHPVRGRRRCGSRVHLDGRRVLQGTHPVRSPHRDVPGGQASLRQHGRCHRTRHECYVGRRPCRRDRRRPAHLRGCRRSHPRGPRRGPVRQLEHPGARRHRDHVGTRRPSLHAPSDHTVALSRRCRGRSRADRPHPTGRRARQGDRAAARGRGDPRRGPLVRPAHQGPAR